MTEKRHIVQLTTEERTRLEGMLKQGQHPAAMLTKMRILLKTDADHPTGGWTDAALCEAVSLQTNRPEAIRKRFVKEGLERLLSRKKRLTPPPPPICDGVQEARLMQRACSEPPPGHARWTLQLLAGKLGARHSVDAVSDDTVRLALKTTHASLLSRSRGSSLRRKTRRSQRRGRTC